VSRERGQQRRQRRQRREQAHRRRNQQRTSHALTARGDVPIQEGMCAIEFGFGDLTPTGTPVHATVFSGLSREQRVIIDDVLGIPPDRWDDIVARQVLTAEVATIETMVYLVPVTLLHGQSAHPPVAPTSAESCGKSAEVVE
jgi:hypothetical protein